MLVDVNTKMNPIMEYLSDVISGSTEIKRLERGVYQIPNFSLDHMIYTDKKVLSWTDMPCSSLFVFGVCDHYEQIFEKCPQLKTSPREFVISLTLIQKATQPEKGGWRWHKWGEYIGDFNAPTTEYIYDEPEIEQVYCYHIYELIEDDET